MVGRTCRGAFSGPSCRSARASIGGCTKGALALSQPYERATSRGSTVRFIHQPQPPRRTLHGFARNVRGKAAYSEECSRVRNVMCNEGPFRAARGGRRSRRRSKRHARLRSAVDTTDRKREGSSQPPQHLPLPRLPPPPPQPPPHGHARASSPTFTELVSTLDAVSPMSHRALS